MDTYEITVKVTIDVPGHEDALQVQAKLADKLMSLVIDDELAPISKVTTKMKKC